MSKIINCGLDQCALNPPNSNNLEQLALKRLSSCKSDVADHFSRQSSKRIAERDQLLQHKDAVKQYGPVVVVVVVVGRVVVVVDDVVVVFAVSMISRQRTNKNISTSCDDTTTEHSKQWVKGSWVSGSWVNGLWVSGSWVNGSWVNVSAGRGLMGHWCIKICFEATEKYISVKCFSPIISSLISVTKFP